MEKPDRQQVMPSEGRDKVEYSTSYWFLIIGISRKDEDDAIEQGALDEDEYFSNLLLLEENHCRLLILTYQLCTGSLNISHNDEFELRLEMLSANIKWDSIEWKF